MNNIDLELYRIFKVVAETSNITHASQILHISQPAVTKQINNLETQLNKTLFIRGKAGTVLNEDGKKLYNEIRESIEKLINAPKILNYDNKIELGVHINMPRNIYNNLVLKYYENNTDSIINIHLLPAETLFNEINNFKIDLIFSKKYTDFDNSDISFIKLGEFEDVFVVNSNSKYLNKEITKQDLRKEDIYTLKKFSKSYENLINTLDYLNDEVNNIIHVNYTGIIDLLNSRDIIAYFPKEYVQNFIEDGTLSILPIESEYNKEEFGIYYNIRNNNTEISKIINFFEKSIHNL